VTDIRKRLFLAACWLMRTRDRQVNWMARAHRRRILEQHAEEMFRHLEHIWLINLNPAWRIDGMTPEATRAAVYATARMSAQRIHNLLHRPTGL
jgi:hypothetical protein